MFTDYCKSDINVVHNFKKKLHNKWMLHIIDETSWIYTSQKTINVIANVCRTLYKFYTNREGMNRVQNTWGEISIEKITDNLFFKII